MPRRRETGGVRKRGRIWWIYYRVDCKRYDESANTGDEREARSYLAETRRSIRDGTWVPPQQRSEGAGGRDQSATIYLRSWCDRRKADGVRGADDERRYIERFAAPALEGLRLSQVERRHIKAMVRTIWETPSETTDGLLSPRTVLHAYAAVRTAFADAVLDGLIPATPCTLKTRRGELPPKEDKDPEWREEARYERDEGARLLSSDEIPIDRRALYGMMLLAGLRGSEANGRRWRDYDREAQPLGRLTVASQADSKKRRSRATKTRKRREVPVVPALAKLLAEWKLAWPRYYGRAPQPDDWICPLQTKVEKPRDHHVHRDLVSDLERLGLRVVPHVRHSMRASLLSWLETDSANMAIVRRATHSAPKDVVGGYIRTTYADVCREFGKLRFELRSETAQVIPLRRAVGDSSGDNQGSDAENANDFSNLVAPGTGLEPVTNRLTADRSTAELPPTERSRTRPADRAASDRQATKTAPTL